jgi:large subunit ribosomal protein L35
MPKMKTVKSAAKRFKIRKNSVKRGAAFRSHILTKKSPQKIANLKSPKVVHSANIDSVNAMLCI